jgi:hypothetical protein
MYFQVTALISNIKGDAARFVHNIRPSSASTFYTQVIYSYHITQLLINDKHKLKSKSHLCIDVDNAVGKMCTMNMFECKCY